MDLTPLVAQRELTDEQASADRRAWAGQTMEILEGLAPEHRSLLRAIYFEHQTIADLAATARESQRRVARSANAALQLFAAAAITAD